MKPEEVSSFVQDFLDIGGNTQTSSGSSATVVGKKRFRANEEDELKADRKRDRERRRRAEVGEKFECLTKVLARAELALGEMQPASSSDEAGSRADVLQRTIDALAALTKAVEEKAPSADERSAVGGLLGVAAAVRSCSVAHALTQTDDENVESVVLIAQTTLPRPKLHELVRSGKALITVTPHLAAASAAASCTLPSNHDKLTALHPSDGLSASDLLFPAEPEPSAGGNNHHSRSHTLPSYFAKAA